MTKSLIAKQPVILALLAAIIYGFMIKLFFFHYGSTLFWLAFSMITIVCAYLAKWRVLQIFIGICIGISLMVLLAFIALNDPQVPVPSTGLFPYALLMWGVYGCVLGGMSSFIAISIKRFTNKYSC